MSVNTLLPLRLIIYMGGLTLHSADAIKFSLRPAFESCCCGVDNSCMSIHSFSALNLAEHLKSFFPITYSLVNGVTAEAAPHF